MLPSNSEEDNEIYYVIFEEYLQPKKNSVNKTNKFQFIKQKQTKLKLLKNWLNLCAVRRWAKNKYQQRLQKFHNYFTRMKKYIKPNEVQEKETTSTKNLIKIPEKFKIIKKFLKIPNFLAFLLARNDDGLCKRKTGFEIYCELASVHGFINFVGAKTWERIFWCSIVFIAILMSTMFLIASHLLNINTPTILYTESTTYPAWTMPFPAVTICNLNRISKERAERTVQKISSPQFSVQQQILPNLQYALYSTNFLNASTSDFRFLQMLLDSKNDTVTKLLHDISPDCASELLRCKWKGRNIQCSQLFRKIETPQGICCTFNYQLKQDNQYQRKPSLHGIELEPEQTTSCGYKTGLTVLLDPKVDDYMAAMSKSFGYQVLIHDAFDYPDNVAKRFFLKARTETTLNIKPRRTYALDYVRDLSLKRRRCYFRNERKLFIFHEYTQINCLAECRSKLLYEKCHCVPTFWPRLTKWPICRMPEAACILAHKDIFTKSLIDNSTVYETDQRAEKFICDCFPECNFNQYASYIDSATLDRNFSQGNKRFFKDIVVENQLLVHIFYGDLIAEKLRMDVHENWLSFVGTFGGITGLYMGYSFVSAFEMIFFVFVRPACNWLTKQQIRYRIKRRQKKVAAAKAAQEAKKEQDIKKEQETKNEQQETRKEQDTEKE